MMMFGTRFLIVCLTLLPLLANSSSSKRSSKKYIVPGADWKDTGGNKIDAHGGGIVKENRTFYWIGGSLGSSGETNLYSSPDLVTWTSHGAVYADNVSRPKLVFSEDDNLWHVRLQPHPLNLQN